MPFFWGLWDKGFNWDGAAALYCRVSTADQTLCRDLRTFAKKAGYKIVGVWKQIASGAKQERAERKKVLAFGAGPQGRRDPCHRTDQLGPFGA
jgi:predicted site-specific integrase-resolvase